MAAAAAATTRHRGVRARFCEIVQLIFSSHFTGLVLSSVDKYKDASRHVRMALFRESNDSRADIPFPLTIY